MIPKKIHYCWFGPNQLSPLNQRCIESWKKLLPDYEIKCWNETNSPLDECPYIREAYAKKKWAHVADYVRLYALYEEGGIYMDTDMYLYQSLDGFLEHEFFIGTMYNDHHLGMGIFGTPSQSVHIAYLMGVYRMMSNFEDRINTTYLENYILSLAKTTSLVVQEVTHVSNIAIYPTEVFYNYTRTAGYNKEPMNRYVTPNVVAIHLWENSWVPEEFLDFWWNNFDAGLRKVKHKLLHNPFQSLQYYKELAWHLRRMWVEQRKQPAQKEKASEQILS